MNRTSAFALFLVCLTVFCTVFTMPAWASDAADVDSWTSKASMRIARSHLGAAVVDEKIYVIGGDAAHEAGIGIVGDGFSGQTLNVNEEYDSVTGVWSLKADMPTTRALFGITVYQNKVYCIGGYYASTPYNSSDVYETEKFNTGANEVYDPATDTWETKTSMPVPSTYTDSNSITANVVNGKIYVISDGVNNAYDPATDTWTTKTPSPYQITSYASAVVDDKIWFIGANSNPSATQVDAFFQIYNPQTDSWEKGASCPTYGATAAAAATTGVNAPKRIYIFEENTTYIYDPANNSWATSSTSMPAARIIAAVAVVNDKFYVVGGRSGQRDTVTDMSPSVAMDQYTPIGYNAPEATATPTSSAAPTQTEFPIATVAAAIVVAVVVIAVIAVALKKRKTY